MRNSSVELYRILATFLVLIVHFNGWFVGMPSSFQGFSLFTVSQAFIEALTCTCVNCFLVITGWYGMKFKWKHVWTIWSILVFIYIPCYLAIALYKHEISIIQLIMNFIAIGKESYYVQCYLMLLVLSPILNSFITRYERKILPYTLTLWLIEFVFDWILKNKCLGFGHGFMLTHFILMYLIGQTSHLYQKEIHKYFTTLRCVTIYVLGSIVITGMYFVISLDIAFAYTNPLNVLMSFSLFFIFENRYFINKTINWISSSTLAVYILHTTPPIINVLWEWDNYALNSYSYSNYLMIILFTILIVFGAGIMYDKIRCLFMPRIGEKVCHWISSKLSKYSLPA